MTVRIRIPANMRPLVQDQATVDVSASTVGQALQDLVDQHPDIQSRLLDANGDLQSYVNVFANERSIRELDGLSTALSDNDEILILPALAGG